MRCEKCGARLQFVEQDDWSFMFRCQKRMKKSAVRKCNNWVSIFKGTFFDRAHLNVPQVAEFVLLYLSRPPPRMQFIEREMGLSLRTITDWFSFVREVFRHWALSKSQQIGGHGVMVEIDEAKIGKRKYNRCRVLVGGIERGTKNFFLVAVPDRTAATLTRIIKEYIRPGTTIYSDC